MNATIDTTACNVTHLEPKPKVKAKPVYQFNKSASVLMKTSFPSVKFIVPGYVPEGLTLLAGKPKLGKSWLTLDMAIAVVTGGSVLGKQVEKGQCLYLGLEDNPRRMKARIKKLRPFSDPNDIEGLTWDTSCPLVGDGCIEALTEWCDRQLNPRLIVIDTLGKVRGNPDNRASAYQDDVRALTPLHTLANQRGIAIILVHHVRKMDAEDPLDTVSGTTGVAGTADTILVLDRRAETGLTLKGRGRDLEDEIDLALGFERETCRFDVRGSATEARRSTERSLILDALAPATDGFTLSEIAAESGMKSNNVKRLLRKMLSDGDVVQPKARGKYLHPNNYKATAITDNVGNVGNLGNLPDERPENIGVDEVTKVIANDIAVTSGNQHIEAVTNAVTNDLDIYQPTESPESPNLEGLE